MSADAPHEVPEGAQPTTNQPLNARPRPRFTPLVWTVLILFVAVVIIVGLGFI